MFVTLSIILEMCPLERRLDRLRREPSILEFLKYAQVRSVLDFRNGVQFWG